MAYLEFLYDVQPVLLFYLGSPPVDLHVQEIHLVVSVLRPFSWYSLPVDIVSCVEPCSLMLNHPTRSLLYVSQISEFVAHRALFSGGTRPTGPPFDRVGSLVSLST